MDLREIGKRCKRIREDYGLTQEEFATRCFVTRITISRFESGLSNNLLLYMEYMKLDGGLNNGEVGKQ